ncbi:hypothetical protein NDU88_000914 [Pleurodeles waltl]|uniref:Uncharacterized protein n=1 Tax=Pleurodeles waltl TaxID=8319 RepID=A0AAV7URC1_PLEWA|nr:hypothetical protein NDU88_000914 [Pleurodeles waltl]
MVGLVSPVTLRSGGGGNLVTRAVEVLEELKTWKTLEGGSKIHVFLESDPLLELLALELVKGQYVLKEQPQGEKTDPKEILSVNILDGNFKIDILDLDFRDGKRKSIKAKEKDFGEGVIVIVIDGTMGVCTSIDMYVVGAVPLLGSGHGCSDGLLSLDLLLWKLFPRQGTVSKEGAPLHSVSSAFFLLFLRSAVLQFISYLILFLYAEGTF